MITADDVFAINEGDSIRFVDTCAIFVHYKTDTKSEEVLIDIQVHSSSTGGQIAGVSIIVDNSSLSAFSTTTTSTTLPGDESMTAAADILQQKAVDYLGGITENAAVTFTIS